MKILSKNGYSILKSDIDENTLNKIRNDLNVKPQINFDNGIPVTSFKIYKENNIRIFLPQNYGYKMFGKPDIIKIKSGEDINIKFNGKLRATQEDPVKKSLKHLNNNMGGILSLECAAGKCFGENTEVLMYDGSIKYIQDILPNELLMGDDSTPRKVISTSSGYGELYLVKQSNGSNYIVNSNHILSLIDNNNNKYDINILNLNKNLYGYKSTVNYKKKLLNKNIYNLGYNYNKKNYIPKDILYNSLDIRLEFITGIIDKSQLIDGNYYINCYNINLKKDIIKLIFSLSLSIKIIDNLNIKIYGYNLNFINPLKTKKIFFNNNFSKLEINKIEPNRYYGLVTDKNHRFLLSDSTVVHNTVMGLYIGYELKEKILVVVHTNVLLDQWIERIKMFLPTARIGIIQGNKFDIDDKDIVISMLQTVVSRDYTTEHFNSFGTVIFDECHHLGARVFSQCFYKVISKNMIGLSATVNRKDGLSKVFKYFIGDIMYSIKKKLNEHDVKIEGINFNSSTEFYKEIYNRGGNLNMPGMMNNIVKIPERNNLIISKIKQCINEGRKLILLSHRIAHLKYLKLLIEKENVCSAGLYIGGMKLCDLDESKKKDILLGSYNMVSEGFDEPSRNTLILSTPLSDVQQSAGRILRKQHEIQPLIIDIIDNFSMFPKQWNKRKRYYKKEKWNIEEITVIDDEFVENIEELNLNKCLI